MIKPLVLVTPSRNEETTSYSLNMDYTKALNKAGCLPLILTYEDAEIQSIDALLDKADGILLSGGGDVGAKYCEAFLNKDASKIANVFPERDDFELALIRQAFSRSIPMFGICRGMQTLNLALGGTLLLDISSDAYAQHSHPQRRYETVHPITTKEGTVLRELGGERAFVNSIHHQAVWTLAPIFVASAVADDGIVEAIESRDARIIGVQWHPEALSTILSENLLEFFKNMLR